MKKESTGWLLMLAGLLAGVLSPVLATVLLWVGAVLIIASTIDGDN